MSLHLLPIPNTDPVAAIKMDTVFLVVQRSNGHWSPAAKILHAMEKEWAAEDMARKLKEQFPQQTFGIFMLRSEAREVANPIQIVRVGDSPEAA